MNWIIKLLINAVSVLVAAYLLPGVNVDGFFAAFVVAIVLAILNAIIKPLLIIITIPITIVTLGLFLLAINAIIILLADGLIDGFGVNGFWWALLFSLLLSILNAVLGVSDKNEHKRK